MSHKTLLLTPWFFPIKILRWEDAVKMKYEGTIEVVAEYEETISSPSVTWKMPAVIRLKKLKVRKKIGVKFSRSNVYARDDFTCQYCRKKLPAKLLTYDHVVPRRSGGRTTWENIVTACSPCNSRKDSKTCDESGMFPINWPKRPASLPISSPIFSQDNIPAEWEDYVGAWAR
ncbi:MAG TPA: HNH endonuclease [Methylobacter sp.]|jgi:5-methylcytosine-specific restriction endonuclease McrA